MRCRTAAENGHAGESDHQPSIQLCSVLEARRDPITDPVMKATRVWNHTREQTRRLAYQTLPSPSQRLCVVNSGTVP